MLRSISTRSPTFDVPWSRLVARPQAARLVRREYGSARMPAAISRLTSTRSARRWRFPCWARCSARCWRSPRRPGGAQRRAGWRFCDCRSSGSSTWCGNRYAIWALIWINVVGLGPFAGVLAIAVSDFGSLGKLFAEIIESADRKPVEGVRPPAGGGSRKRASACCRRFCPSWRGKCSISSNPTPARRLSSASSARGHRPGSGRADPRARVATGAFLILLILDRGRGDRFRLRAPARRHRRPAPATN